MTTLVAAPSPCCVRETLVSRNSQQRERPAQLATQRHRNGYRAAKTYGRACATRCATCPQQTLGRPQQGPQQGLQSGLQSWVSGWPGWVAEELGGSHLLLAPVTRMRWAGRGAHCGLLALPYPASAGPVRSCFG
jgi:hypothetical protein